MADKLTIPNILDYFDGTGLIFDFNSFENSWNNVLNSIDNYDLSPLKDYNSYTLSGASLYDIAVDPASDKSIIPYIFKEDYKQSERGKVFNDFSYTDTFNSFFENLKLSSNLSSNDDGFDIGLDSLDTTSYFAIAGMILVFLLSIFCVKRAVRLFK